LSTAADRRQRVQSAETGMAVLKALARLGGSASLTAIAAEVQESAAKVHRYLASLGQEALVAQNPATQHYQLGPESIRIGLAALRQCDPVRMGEGALLRLREALQVTSFIAVMGNRGPTVLRMEEPALPVTVGTTIRPVGPTTMPLAFERKIDGAKLQAPQPFSGATGARAPVDEISRPMISDALPLASMLRTADPAEMAPKYIVASTPRLKPAGLTRSGGAPAPPHRMTILPSMPIPAPEGRFTRAVPTPPWFVPAEPKLAATMCPAPGIWRGVGAATAVDAAKARPTARDTR
jgi:hypothetical protein